MEQEKQALQRVCNEEFLFRRLEIQDYDKGFLQVLSQLTEVGQISKQDFETRFNQMFPSEIYNTFVIVNRQNEKVIGAGSLVVEKKFIRKLGKAGHIEDIVVLDSYRSKNLGIKLISLLKEIALINGCYKVILDCGDKNVGFYKKVRL